MADLDSEDQFSGCGPYIGNLTDSNSGLARSCSQRAAAATKL